MTFQKHLQETSSQGLFLHNLFSFCISYLLYEVKTLCIVHPVYGVPLNAFPVKGHAKSSAKRNDSLGSSAHCSLAIASPVVLQLLQGEDVLVKILLELLIGVVDVKLLKPIHLQASRHILYLRNKKEKDFINMAFCFFCRDFLEKPSNTRSIMSTCSHKAPCLIYTS